MKMLCAELFLVFSPGMRSPFLFPMPLFFLLGLVHVLFLVDIDSSVFD